MFAEEMRRQQALAAIHYHVQHMHAWLDSENSYGGGITVTASLGAALASVTEDVERSEGRLEATIRITPCARNCRAWQRIQWQAQKDWAHAEGMADWEMRLRRAEVLPAVIDEKRMRADAAWELGKALVADLEGQGLLR
jgi:hypothetical protein